MIPLEELPRRLPEDLLWTNRMVWHGFQHVLRGEGTPVYPEVQFSAYPPDQPISFEFLAEAPEPPYEPWARQGEMNFEGKSYDVFKITRISIDLANIHATPEIRAQTTESLVSTMVLRLGAVAARNVGRTDLGHELSRRLISTDYIFWLDQQTVRQDTFDVGNDLTHTVAANPTVREVKQLHDGMYTNSWCACGPMVALDHYGSVATLPDAKARRLT